jgi:hypothetical protein
VRHKLDRIPFLGFGKPQLESSLHTTRHPCGLVVYVCMATVCDRYECVVVCVARVGARVVSTSKKTGASRIASNVEAVQRSFRT